jgi:hypothetical protein
MRIDIRGVPDAAGKILADRAQATGMSLTEYLRVQLEKLAYDPELYLYEQRRMELEEMMITALEKCAGIITDYKRVSN